MSLNLLYSVREGLLGLRRAQWATLITVSTIAITMTLLGVFLVLTFNVQGIARRFQEKVTFEVFVDNSLSAAEIEIIGRRLSNLEGVDEVSFISKEAALERYLEDFGDDPLEIVGHNPLPASFQVSLLSDFRTPDRAEAVVGKATMQDGVQKVVYHKHLFRTIYRYSRIVILIDVTLLLTVLLTAILLVANTLRLTILSQSKTIQIMELVGATEGFIRRPYLIQGMLQGGIGGAIGTIVVWIVIKGVSLRFPDILEVSPPVVFIPFVLGILLGFLGGNLGLRRFLRRI